MVVANVWLVHKKKHSNMKDKRVINGKHVSTITGIM